MAPRTMLLLSLAACLAIGASAQLPRSLKNSGYPPFLEGLVYNINATDSDTPYSVGYTWQGKAKLAYPQDEGMLYFQAKYTSWECGSTPGSYRAMFEYTETAPDGTITGPYKACEYGIASLDEGYAKWTQSAEACPVAWDGAMYSILLKEQDTPNPCGEPPAADSPFEGSGALRRRL